VIERSQTYHLLDACRSFAAHGHMQQIRSEIEYIIKTENVYKFFFHTLVWRKHYNIIDELYYDLLWLTENSVKGLLFRPPRSVRFRHAKTEVSFDAHVDNRH